MGRTAGGDWIDATARRLVLAALALALLGASTLVAQRAVVESYWLTEVRDSWVRLFSLDGEGNVPTWFSGTLLAACAVVAGLRSRAGAWRAHWRAIAVGFLALSMDEVASVHEMTMKPIRIVYDPRGLLYYVWIVPAAALLLAAVPFFWRFLRGLAPEVRRRMLLGAGLLATGALGVEAVTGLLMDRYGHGLAYGLAVLVEEPCEMLGTIGLLSALLLELRSQWSPATPSRAMPSPSVRMEGARPQEGGLEPTGQVIGRLAPGTREDGRGLRPL